LAAAGLGAPPKTSKTKGPAATNLASVPQATVCKLGKNYKKPTLPPTRLFRDSRAEVPTGPAYLLPRSASIFSTPTHTHTPHLRHEAPSSTTTAQPCLSLSCISNPLLFRTALCGRNLSFRLRINLSSTGQEFDRLSGTKDPDDSSSRRLSPKQPTSSVIVDHFNRRGQYKTHLHRPQCILLVIQDKEEVSLP